MVKKTETASALVEIAHEQNWVKNDSEIGAIDWKFSGVLMVNGVELPENSVKFIIDWGFKQPLMNAYADNKKDAVAEWTRVLGNIIAGKVSAEGRTRIDPVWAEMRVIVAPKLATAMGYKSVGAATKANPDGAWLKLVDAACKQHEAMVRPVAAKNVAERNLDLGDALRQSLALAAAE